MKTSPRAAVVALVVTGLFGVASAGPVLAASAVGMPLARVADQVRSRAHTALKSSNPAKDAKVDSLRRVTLVYTESVRFPVVVVLGKGEKRFEDGKPKVEGPKVTVDVVDELPAGAYRIAWRVVSRDGHPLEGEIPFTVTPAASQEPSAAAPSAAASSEAAPSAATPPVEASEAAQDRAGGIPAWVWITIFGIAGIGIGMAFSMRKRP